MSDDDCVRHDRRARTAMGRVEESEALERGWTLPADWYTDPHIFDLELDRIFGREWQYAGHSPACSGARFLLHYDGRPDSDRRRSPSGRRAGRPCERVPAPRTSRRARIGMPRDAAMPLPRLDVRARRAPAWGAAIRPRGVVRRRRRADCDPSSWTHGGPLIFVNPDLAAPALAACARRPYRARRERGFDLNGRPLRATRQWEIKCNWKLTLDNNTECYHCATVHPGFRNEYHVDRDNYRITAFERSFSHISPHKGEHEPDGMGRLPRQLLVPELHALGPRQRLLLHLQLRAGRPAYHAATQRLLLPRVLQRQEVKEAVEDIAQIMREDWAVFERVQTGLRSGMIAHGRLLKTRSGCCGTSSESAMQR